MGVNNKIKLELYLIQQDQKAVQLPETHCNQIEIVFENEVVNGSKGYQKELMGLLSFSHAEQSIGETAQLQLKNGYLDITI